MWCVCVVGAVMRRGVCGGWSGVCAECVCVVGGMVWCVWCVCGIGGYDVCGMLCGVWCVCMWWGGLGM